MFYFILFNNRVQCKPKCRITCKNGYCDKPYICTCPEGYIKKHYWSGTVCEPICVGCYNGKCVHNICECNAGYVLQKGTCKLECSDTENGTDCLQITQTTDVFESTTQTSSNVTETSAPIIRTTEDKVDKNYFVTESEIPVTLEDSTPEEATIGTDFKVTETVNGRNTSTKM